MVSKYTKSTLKPILENNFKIFIPEVNIFINAGKKITFFIYELAGLLVLKIIGIVVY